ncbi:Gfo/Idh/MocA family oxidoreductase [Streptomyces sp. RS10V-4]|uniref:Gfo/Idh/MocA family protein n=1 Tax=Streptomyces rhizoryzae TaxID=2932493 RepID=UPI002005CFDA|nr:Gfo/Idh/MocA family oxidoreductase [Streptomyces rhizoryzae]MCK7624327.1 Gfo/Idh/MocA family oxidoreductase [Streptomyces rhizoryzae]
MTDRHTPGPTTAPGAARRPLRVGVIGANPDRGWAARAHIPALAALPDYALTAVATSRPESARAAARAFGAAHAFTDAGRLAAHPEVDLVVVTVKVPAHAELVGAALAAGKHVYCEWPLARTTEEAATLAAAAERAGVHHALGLQARYAPAVSYARELVAAGRLGRITSATVHAARGKGAGPALPAWAAYTLDRASGAGTLEVAGGHTLDTLEYVLGGITDLSAALSVQRPAYTVAETGGTVPVTSPDHLLLHATLTSGAVVSAHIHDGKVTGAGTRLEISGTEGDLALVSPAAGGPAGIQIDGLRLLGTDAPGGAFRELTVPPGHRSATALPPDAEGFNVAQLYARLARDLRTGTRTVPDFTTGLRLHRLLDAIRRSAATGTRQTVRGPGARH